MANTVVETITVAALTKYGFKGTDGKFVSWSKFVSDAVKAEVVPGLSFEGELYVSPTGTRYLNKIVKKLEAKNLGAPAAVPKPSVKKTVPVVEDKPMSRADWDSKDKRISRHGVIQAAVQAVAPHVALEEVFKAAEALANQMLDYVNDK